MSMPSGSRETYTAQEVDELLQQLDNSLIATLKEDFVPSAQDGIFDQLLTSKPPAAGDRIDELVLHCNIDDLENIKSRMKSAGYTNYTNFRVFTDDSTDLKFSKVSVVDFMNIMRAAEVNADSSNGSLQVMQAFVNQENIDLLALWNEKYGFFSAELVADYKDQFALRDILKKLRDEITALEMQQSKATPAAQAEKLQKQLDSLMGGFVESIRSHDQILHALATKDSTVGSRTSKRGLAALAQSMMGAAETKEDMHPLTIAAINNYKEKLRIFILKYPIMAAEIIPKMRDGADFELVIAEFNRLNPVSNKANSAFLDAIDNVMQARFALEISAYRERSDSPLRKHVSEIIGEKHEEAELLRAERIQQQRQERINAGRRTSSIVVFNEGANYLACRELLAEKINVLKEVKGINSDEIPGCVPHILDALKRQLGGIDASIPEPVWQAIKKELETIDLRAILQKDALLNPLGEGDLLLAPNKPQTLVSSHKVSAVLNKPRPGSVVETMTVVSTLSFNTRAIEIIFTEAINKAIKGAILTSTPKVS